jgi:hypothetical protein
MSQQPNDDPQASNDDAREEMRRFEAQEEVPKDLKEWPDGKAKNITFGGDEDEPYGEGKTAKLGPPLTHNEDGSVTIDGEVVGNPEDYKGEPIESPIQSFSEQVADKDD